MSEILILIILFLTSGDLIPRHQQVFRSNVFFSGVSIPEPDTTVRIPLALRLFSKERREKCG